ncbi:MAG TPA: hypothetical protein VGF89_00905 [Steroidobacteraceae bacterium]|jgi:hypothetical protein
MIAVSFYDKATGLFTGRRLVSTHDGALEINTPEGCAAMDGEHDHLSSKVDLSDPSNPKVVDYQPPAPSNDHEWNADTKRWQLKTAAQALLDSRQRATWAIRSLEASQPRCLRELALALHRNDAGGAAAAAVRLQGLDDQIAKHRETLK